MGTTAYAARVSSGYAYPTAVHERAAFAITEFFASRDETDAVLLVNSCARGKATVDSCLDMQVIVPPSVVERVDADFRRFAAESDAVAALLVVGRFSDLHLDVSDGVLAPGPIDDEGIDWFEASVGNLFVYSAPLYVRGERLERLSTPWLPFYDEALRHERLQAARWFARQQPRTHTVVLGPRPLLPGIRPLLRMKKRKLDKLDAKQARVLGHVDRIDERIRDRQLEALDEHRQQLLERRDLLAARVERNPGDYLSRRELDDIDRRLAALDTEVRQLRMTDPTGQTGPA
jgi:hypothetical protein